MSWLKRIRTEMGWTQQQLAEEIGVTNSFICDVEHGNRWLSAEKVTLLEQQTGYRDLAYLQAVERGEFTLRMPEVYAGKRAVQCLMAHWTTLTREQFEQLLAVAHKETA